jgi:hypothetical protein
MLAHAFSCGKDPDPKLSPPAFQLPANVYSITKVYDIGNNSSPNDLRVEVTFLTSVALTDLVEARLVIVKASKSLTVDQISTLTSSNSFTIALSASASQVIKPAGASDSDGDPVVNGTPYRVYVAILGKEGTKQLSGAKDITLADKPVFAGNYVGSWGDLGPPGPGTFPMSMRIADDYSGQMFYANANFTPYSPTGAQDATTTIVVTGDAFSFNLNQFIPGYSGGGAPGGTPTPNCPASKTLTGHIVDDIRLVFDTFSWADCDGTRDVKMEFTRQ